jgi:hypothetical protein
MALLENIPGLARVITAWTGNVSVTIGATSATISPGVGSAASVWSDLLAKCRLIHGGTWSGWADASGILQIHHSINFTLTSTLLTKSRLNLSASASGTTVSGAGAHLRGYYPMSLGFTGYDIRKDDGAAAADGSGATPLIWGSGTASVEVLDTWANNYALQEALMEGPDVLMVDIWMGGRRFGRFAIEDVGMKRAGILTGYTTLSLDMIGVS